MNIEKCDLCPRMCGVNRNERAGYCGMTSEVRVAKAMLHYGEEPCISGKEGSGAVFFSGCVLKCRYCQNYNISSGGEGKGISIERLSEIFLELQRRGANNLNMVTPTQYSPQILSALDLIKGELSIPVVWNTGGYERSEVIKELSGRVNVFLADMKYKDSGLSAKYSSAADYYENAMNALEAMLCAVGEPTYDEKGMMRSGVIIRHLVLPGCYHDSIDILRDIKARFGTDSLVLSLMSQYTPCFEAEKYREINRKVTTFEYRKVMTEAENLGFNGFVQDKSSATLAETPVFDLEGV